MFLLAPAAGGVDYSSLSLFVPAEDHRCWTQQHGKLKAVSLQ